MPSGKLTALPSGVIVPLVGVLSTSQACQWMTGEGFVVVGSQVRCLWTKSWAPVMQNNGQYR